MCQLSLKLQREVEACWALHSGRHMYWRRCLSPQKAHLSFFGVGFGILSLLGSACLFGGSVVHDIAIKDWLTCPLGGLEIY